ncbi:PREDICTED: protein RRP5 homolog [Ceratosolen solmsi marchali]|uniref:Protein RRP5 homolog n=1 Tax=Ceratosolen solmsi marchali TaxID=326594 RepID=A0AAJ6YDN5_9HYME|nr:PREDICTED: protein RRP5 homolog [Ceratosolen solmsi marchali]
MVLKHFPREGKSRNIKSSQTSLSKLTKCKLKKYKYKDKIKEKLSIQGESITLNLAQNLKYSTLNKEMIILGRIFKVLDIYIIVSLPGQIKGKIQVVDISESYTNLLKNITNNKKVINELIPLTNLYKKGDYVICYVKDIDSKKIYLSLQPYLINQNLNPKMLTKGSKIILSVKSIEDHGYILETGLKNLRAFLCIEDVECKVNFYPGKQIVCIIKDVEVEENIFTIKVSVKSKHLDNVETNVSCLDHLIPGTQYSLKIKKITKNGLQIYYSGKYIGYINQFYLQHSLLSFKEEQEIVGRLLYIIPLIKIAYFSLLSLEQETKLLKIGDIINKAKVVSYDSKGIFVKIKGLRGYIPLQHNKPYFKKIESIFSINSVHKCKVITYDLIAKLYICTIEKKLIEYINHSDLELGNRTEVIITSINEKKKYINVVTGKIFGIVPFDQISDSGLINELNVGQRFTARVLKLSKNIIFTLKKSLVESKLPILCKIEDAKINSVYDGSIIKIINEGIIVSFFGNVKGWIPKHFLNHQTTLQKQSQNWNFVIGQTIKTVVKSINIHENKIILALSNSKIKNYKYKIGDTIEGIVIDSSIAGIHVRIINKNRESIIAFLPTGHMSPCYEIGKMLATKIVTGDILSATIFSTYPKLILSSTFAPEIAYKMSTLNPGDSILCSVSKIFKESIKVLLPIAKFYKYVTVPINEVGNFEYLYENQIVFGKILRLDKETQSINLTIKLNKIWENVTECENKMTAINVLSCYLNKILELSKNIFYASKSISKIYIGERVNGTVENIMDYGLTLKLKKNIKGIVSTGNFFGNYKQGDQIEGLVLWINYPQEYVEITMIHNDVNSIQVKQNNLSKIPIGTELRGKIVLVTNWFILAILKGQAKGTLVTLPVRRHLNDTIPDINLYQIGIKIRCFTILNKKEADLLLPICMLKSAFKTHKIEQQKPFHSSLKLKRKMETTDENKNTTVVEKLYKMNYNDNIKREINQMTNKGVINKDIEIIKLKSQKRNENIQNDSDKNSNKPKKKDKQCTYNINCITKETPKVFTNFSLNLNIAKCRFKWNSLLNERVDIETSSDDEVNDSTKKLKKKKLSTSEKNALERQKEKEIREREEVLASTLLPQTVDQFDKLVLSNPNSSLIWIQYIAHYLQTTEIEKARAIAKRALKVINFREENEKLNIWQALLNLESRFGSSESLTEVFQEAIKANDVKKIYEHMLTIYTITGKQSELENIIKTMINKFKQHPETWISCGAIFLKIGMKNKSRDIMQRALQSLPKNKHVNLMIQFAQLENKLGDKERTQTLFEQILSSYSKRTNVWLSYVDSLVKSGEIEIARKILDRAISQDLSTKKMKILFEKYINFEEKYGTKENILRIQALAVKYVEEQCKKVDYI